MWLCPPLLLLPALQPTRPPTLVSWAPCQQAACLGLAQPCSATFFSLEHTSCPGTHWLPPPPPLMRAATESRILPMSFTFNTAAVGSDIGGHASHCLCVLHCPGQRQRVACSLVPTRWSAGSDPLLTIPLYASLCAGRCTSTLTTGCAGSGSTLATAALRAAAVATCTARCTTFRTMTEAALTSMAQNNFVGATATLVDTTPVANTAATTPANFRISFPSASDTEANSFYEFVSTALSNAAAVGDLSLIFSSASITSLGLSTVSVSNATETLTPPPPPAACEWLAGAAQRVWHARACCLGPMGRGTCLHQCPVYCLQLPSPAPATSSLSSCSATRTRSPALVSAAGQAALAYGSSPAAVPTAEHLRLSCCPPAACYAAGDRASSAFTTFAVRKWGGAAC